MRPAAAVLSLISTPSKRAVASITVAALLIAGVAGALLYPSSDSVDFQRHQKVSASSRLRIAFPEKMDHYSVEQHVILPEDLHATVSWDDESLILTPSVKLTHDKRYTVRIDGSALKADGVPLGSDLVYTFDVSGAPVVMATVPTGTASSIATDTDIVLVFDRPMVPLSQVQGKGDAFARWPVKIAPPVRGRWRWLGTTTASFEPSEKLKKATRYVVSVPRGIPTLSGELTEKDFSWSFTTIRPLLVATSPEKQSMNSGPSTKISLTFSEPMDIAQAKDFLILRKIPVSPQGSAVGSGSLIALKAASYGTMVINKKTVINKSELVLTPSSPLQFSSTYRLSIAAGLPSLEGDLGLEAPEELTFSTVGDFTVDNADYDSRSSMLTIDVTSPTTPELVAKNLVFSPPVTIDPQYISVFQLYSNNSRISLYPQLKPSTKYTVTLSPSMTDSFGQKLKKPWTYSFTTPQRAPSVFVYPRQREFGIFEKSKPVLFYINHRNVPSVHVAVGAVPLQKFLGGRLSRLGSQSTDRDIRAFTDTFQEFDIPSTTQKNEWGISTFDLRKNLQGLSSGLYALTVTSPAWVGDRGESMVETRIFAVTDMNITLKYSGQKALVWVTNLQTGEPVKGANVEFHALNGSVPLKGTTNASGIFEAPMSITDFRNSTYDYQPEFYVTAAKDGDIAFTGSQWNQGVDPGQFNVGSYLDFRSPESPAYRLPYFLYTERPLYGAGDTVYFKGIVRFLDWNGSLSLPNKTTRSVDVTVTDADGKVVYTKSLPFSAFGSFSDKFTLAKEASLGYYSISAKVLPESDVGQQMTSGFSVLAYRKPEYKLTLDADKQEYSAGDTATVAIDGRYYFGAPMANASVKWRVVSMDYFFNKAGDEWYSFGDTGSQCWYRCERQSGEVTTGEGKLDAAGKLTVSVPTTLDAKRVSQVFTLEADVTDKNNQVVSGRADFIVHTSNVYVGIKSDEYAVQAGSSVQVDVKTFTPDGSPRPSTSVSLALFSRVWNVTEQKGVDGDFYYESTPLDTQIGTQSVTTDADGKAKASLKLPKSGEYVVKATAKDENGRANLSSWSVYAWSGEYFTWPRSSNDRMDLVVSKPSFRIGETATIVMKSPYQGKGVKALVTVERENVMTKKVIDVTSSAQSIEIPVTEDMIPVAYVSVVVLKPRMGETFDDRGSDTGGPAFKVGLAKILIDSSPKKLTVAIKTDKERYLPGDTVHATIEAFDAKGAPVAAEFSLGVVDLSLIDLTGFTMPDIVSSFYYDRGVGVITANMLSYLVEHFKPGSKGGGGDGDEKKRGNFLDTAYWNPTILTNANGQASVTFTLPDNLTTWQLLAFGSTKDNRFGGAVKTVLETKRVIVRPVRPRFAVAGDKAILGAIVHNYLDADRTFTVTLAGEGFVSTGPATQRVFVAKDGNVKVNFPVTFSSARNATLHFTATTDGAKDEIEETIPLYSFGVLQTVATTGTVESSVDESFVIPSKKHAPEGTISLSIAPTLAVYLPTALEFLAQFPYGCAEQTMSALIPNLALAKLKNMTKVASVSDAELQKNVTVGLQKIYVLQNGDGGFGYFQSSDRSYPYLTAYVLFGFKTAMSAGYAVDQTVQASALEYLKRNVRTSATVDAPSRAYIAYVLSLYGAGNTSELTDLYKNRVDLPLFSRAYLALAMKNANQNDKAKTLVSELLSAVRVDARGAHFEESERGYYGAMNTDATTTAVVLQAVLAVEPDSVLVPKIVRGMLASRHDGHWDTTQSTAQSLLAFVDFLKTENDLTYAYSASADLGGKRVLNHAFKSPTIEKIHIEKSIDEFVRGSTVPLKIAKEGAGNLYYDATMSYFYTPNVIEPAEQGIGILRETSPLTKDDAGMKVGSIQKVRLTITVPETRHFVAVESMLAAGFEPIDLGYATSQQTLLQNAANASDGNYVDYYRNQMWRFSHIEYRDDRVFLFADELPAGVYRYEYLQRATTPGTFRERPAKVWEMYYPETFGQTEGGPITITQ